MRNLFLLFIGLFTIQVATAQNKSNAEYQSSAPKIKMNSNGDPEFKICDACGTEDGKIIEMEAHSKLRYDTVCNSYTNDINLKELNGIWHYEKTFIFSNNNYFVEKERNYFSNIPEEYVVDSTTLNVDLSKDKMMEKKAEAKELKAKQLGRDYASLEDQIIPFDKNIHYKFLNKEGEDNDYFVLYRITKKNVIQYLTAGEVRFKGYTLTVFNKSYLELFYAGSNTSKKFRILTLNKFIMILADDKNKEIQYFKR